ncbi:MAG: DUF262 domain-containing protein [Chloracidobacterium sp.]|nr:DUF262 domain-containing protein [Chloracidobacterium sp.]
MIKSVNNYPISQLFDIDASVVYVIPKYQREYTWGKQHWQNLFDDLIENDPGYFLGSIICINQSTDTLAIQELEVVDGQQRLTTISLLFAAVYKAFGSGTGELNEDLLVERNNMKRKLVLRGASDRMRVVPQSQNRNHDDYRAILSEIEVINQYEIPLNAGNRRVMKAFRYFQTRIEELITAADDRNAALIGFVDKLSRASLVKIEVASHTDAYVLFESLNDRGMPLTAVDLIKNKLLAKIDRDDPVRVDYYFEQWLALLNELGEEYAIHERFFRQYYNAFKDELKGIIEVPIATRSNLIFIFEKLINHNATECLTKAAAAARLYSFILSRRTDNTLQDLRKPLQDLERIQGAPSYVLLLNLLTRRGQLGLNTEHLKAIINDLAVFFVRRNLTDTPPTHEVARLPLKILEGSRGLTGQDVVDFIQAQLAAVSSTDAEFRRRLEGSIYEENIGVARYVLTALAEDSMTTETFTDLWEKPGTQMTWTIEHIFPQGENIPESWVQMMADGDSEHAKQIQLLHVHRLGNLTITGYNSSLGNKSFVDKRDRTDSAGRFVGYKNGLSLNSELADTDRWSVEQIQSRGAALVNRAMELFAFPGVPE